MSVDFYKKILELLDFKEKMFFVFVVTSACFLAILETISLAAIIPIIQIIFNENFIIHIVLILIAYHF